MAVTADLLLVKERGSAKRKSRSVNRAGIKGEMLTTISVLLVSAAQAQANARFERAVVPVFLTALEQEWTW